MTNFQLTRILTTLCLTDLYVCLRMDQEGSEDRQAELESGLGKGEREGRGFLYWATTTDISTSTTFSATSTLASLACTPSAFTINQCG